MTSGALPCCASVVKPGEACHAGKVHLDLCYNLVREVALANAHRLEVVVNVRGEVLAEYFYYCSQKVVVEVDSCSEGSPGAVLAGAGQRDRGAHILPDSAGCHTEAACYGPCIDCAAAAAGVVSRTALLEHVLVDASRAQVRPKLAAEA